MKTEHKIYAAILVLLALGGIFYLTNTSNKASKEAHQAGNQKGDLPALALKPEDIDRVTKLELTPAGKEAVVLEKGADGWAITAPKPAKANAADVKSLLEGLKNLKVTDAIDRGTGAYDKYEVADGKGTHFVLSMGNEKPIDVIFGQSGSRGQTLRVIGRDGVYVAEGYQGSYFSKDMKGWRDKAILKFEDANVASVDIQNDNGHFVFTKAGDNWSGKFDKNPNKKEEPAEKKDDAKKDDKADAKKDDKADPKKDDAKKDDKADAKKADAKKDDKADAKKDDAKKDDAKKDDKADPKKDEPKNAGWEKFDGKTVENMLRAFKTLSAVDFADDGADTGVDAAAKEGGMITITMKDGTVHKLAIGKKQKGTNRFTKKNGDETVFVISSWAGDWATAEPKKFEKKDDKKDDKKGPPPDADPHGGMDEPDFDLPMDE